MPTLLARLARIIHRPGTVVAFLNLNVVRLVFKVLNGALASLVARSAIKHTSVYSLGYVPAIA